jgi:hypothetical protein
MKNKIKSVVLIGIGFGLGFAAGKNYLMTQLKQIFEDDTEDTIDSIKRDYYSKRDKGAYYRYASYAKYTSKPIIPKTDDIVFASRADAQEVLTTFAHVIDNYGQARVRPA